MKASRFSDAQKAFILKQGSDRKAGISQATYFYWKRKYDGLLPTEMRQLKQAEDENSKLRKVVADLSLDKEKLQDVISAAPATPSGPRPSLGSNMPLLRTKAEDLVLAGPVGWQVGEAGNSHAMRELPVDGGLDEIGREEGQRDCHIHLADAAPLALSDAFRGCRFLGDKFIEPTAPAGDRCDQGGAIFRTYRPGGVRRHSIRDKNRTAPP